MSLFNIIEDKNKQTPIAELLRPKNLNEYLGQNQIINENKALYNLIKSKRLFSLILWGPPGCGKTTFARLLANEVEANFIELSAVSTGIKDLKNVVEQAKEALITTSRKTVLFIDEIHRYSKTQQDAILPYLENGTIHLIGSTTENPSFQVIPALLSRVQVIMLKPIDDENILRIIRRGFKYLIDKYGKINLDDKIGEFIVAQARGDARVALNIVENSYFASDFKDKERFLTLELVQNLIQNKVVKYGIQEHYDHLSAFQKSLRGSDKNAGIYWLAKMISSGEDPRIIARRMIVCASEDVGNADSNALNVAINAQKVVETIGLPEARIALAQAVEYIADAPKLNRAIKAIDSALFDISQGKDYSPPKHLRDAHYKDAKNYGFGVDYIYSHNSEESQQFMPDELADKKYFE